MKKLIICLAVLMTMGAASVLVSAKSLDIKMQQPVFEDYIPLLEQAGYYLYSFDIKSLNDRNYQISISCREYEGDSLISRNIMPYHYVTSNLVLVKDFPEDQQKDFKPEELYDSERGIYKCAEKIVLGTYPQNDSTAIVSINLEDISDLGIPLNLRPVKDAKTGKDLYIYQPRPFEVGDFKLGTFIPLVFYGSAWIDEKFGFFRFCGASVLKPEMTDRLIKDVPHSFVIGITVKEASPKE